MRSVCASLGGCVSQRACPVGPTDLRHSSRCRAFARKRRRPDGLVGAAGTSGSTFQSHGGKLHDSEGRHARRADRLRRIGPNQGQLGLGQYWRRRDDRGRTAARASHNKTSGLAAGPGDDRTIQSRSCDATRASALVLAGRTPLNPRAVDLAAELPCRRFSGASPTRVETEPKRPPHRRLRDSTSWRPEAGPMKS